MVRTYFNIAIVLSYLFLISGCKQKEPTTPSTVNVKVMVVCPSVISDGRVFSGTIEESSGSTLSFPIAGTIQQILVSEGERINKGVLLATLDETSLKNAHDAAVAALEQAEDAYRRLKLLYDNNSLPEIQWVEVQSKLKQAQSVEHISAKNLSECRLYAPFSGVISKKEVEVGHNVLPGVPVVKLVSVNQVKVCISVPENEISRIRTNQSARITVPALDGKTFIGKVVEKGISANPLSRSYMVKVIVENPASELMPGMICELHFDKAEGINAIILPYRIVQIDDTNKTFVWVCKAGKAHKRFVEIGQPTKDGVIILRGLVGGDEILVEGQQKVSEGMSIKKI